jgi:hypothetical protein
MMKICCTLFAVLFLACAQQMVDGTPPPQTTTATSTAGVFTDPAAFAGRSLRIEAELLGYRRDECRFAPAARDTSLTRSDWLVRSGSYCLYVTGSRFDPALGGQRGEVRARVVDDGNGKYLLAAE